MNSVPSSRVEYSCVHPMALHYDNQTTIYNASNPTFHECTKHIEVVIGFVKTPFVVSSEQLANIFTKRLGTFPNGTFCTKLGMLDIYSPA